MHYDVAVIGAGPAGTAAYSAVIGLAARRLLAEPTTYSPSADRT
jgi:flavin-dependent dehydrogenase